MRAQKVYHEHGCKKDSNGCNIRAFFSPEFPLFLSVANVESLVASSMVFFYQASRDSLGVISWIAVGFQNTDYSELLMISKYFNHSQRRVGI